jgi:hypothetical protein
VAIAVPPYPLRRAIAVGAAPVLVGAGHVVGEILGGFPETRVTLHLFAALLLTKLICAIENTLRYFREIRGFLIIVPRDGCR